MFLKNQKQRNIFVQSFLVKRIKPFFNLFISIPNFLCSLIEFFFHLGYWRLHKEYEIVILKWTLQTKLKYSKWLNLKVQLV